MNSRIANKGLSAVALAKADHLRQGFGDRSLRQGFGDRRVKITYAKASVIEGGRSYAKASVIEGLVYRYK